MELGQAWNSSPLTEGRAAAVCYAHKIMFDAARANFKCKLEQSYCVSCKENVAETNGHLFFCEQIIEE